MVRPYLAAAADNFLLALSASEVSVSIARQARCVDIDIAAWAAPGVNAAFSTATERALTALGKPTCERESALPPHFRDAPLGEAGGAVGDAGTAVSLAEEQEVTALEARATSRIADLAAAGARHAVLFVRRAGVSADC